MKLMIIQVERTPAYQRHQCREWMKLGLQGVSVIFSSGDWGVASRQHVELHGHVHHMCLDATRSILTTYGNRFVPDFPVNCPFITAGKKATLHTESLAFKVLLRLPLTIPI